MARIRNAGTPNPLKRPRESVSPVRSGYRVSEPPITAQGYPTVRIIDPPSKKVHWGRGNRIISGPTISDPERRSQSPTRSALRRTSQEADEEEESDDSSDWVCPVEAQLEAERRNGSRLSPQAYVKDNQTYELVSEPPSVGIVSGKGAATRSKAQLASANDDNDEAICKQLDDLKSMVREFVSGFKTRPEHARTDVLSQLFRPESELLVRYIGSIALGGGKGSGGWQELLADETSCKALVWAVVGKALKENVFDQLYFGAWPELEAKLQKLEQVQALQDGFYRQRARSDEITKQQAGRAGKEMQVSFARAAVRVTLGLEALLLPLWELGEKSLASWRASGMHSSLFTLVATAGTLARSMRKARDVIYYWPPTLKDEEFEPARMECINLEDIIRTSPYDRKQIQGRGSPVLRKDRADESQAIVRVVCFPGVQAFRQGGGALAKKQLAAEGGGENNAPPDVVAARRASNAPPDVVAARRGVRDKYGREYAGNEGMRTRVVGKGVVLLQWGQQRLLTREAGTAVHIDAVREGKLERYAKDIEGHVPLLQLFQERMAGRTMRTAPFNSSSALFSGPPMPPFQSGPMGMFGAAQQMGQPMQMGGLGGSTVMRIINRPMQTASLQQQTTGDAIQIGGGGMTVWSEMSPPQQQQQQQRSGSLSGWLGRVGRSVGSLFAQNDDALEDGFEEMEDVSMFGDEGEAEFTDLESMGPVDGEADFSDEMKGPADANPQQRRRRRQQQRRRPVSGERTVSGGPANPRSKKRSR